MKRWVKASLADSAPVFRTAIGVQKPLLAWNFPLPGHKHTRWPLSDELRQCSAMAEALFFIEWLSEDPAVQLRRSVKYPDTREVQK